MVHSIIISYDKKRLNVINISFDLWYKKEVSLRVLDNNINFIAVKEIFLS